MLLFYALFIGVSLQWVAIIRYQRAQAKVNDATRAVLEALMNTDNVAVEHLNKIGQMVWQIRKELK